MRCSICDDPETRFVFHNWHCFKCEEAIRVATGEYNEEDIFDMFEEDDTPGLPDEDTPKMP